LRLRSKPAYNIEAGLSAIAPSDKQERVTGEAPLHGTPYHGSSGPVQAGTAGHSRARSACNSSSLSVSRLSVSRVPACVPSCSTWRTRRVPAGSWRIARQPTYEFVCENVCGDTPPGVADEPARECDDQGEDEDPDEVEAGADIARMEEAIWGDERLARGRSGGGVVADPEAVVIVVGRTAPLSFVWVGAWFVADSDSPRSGAEVLARLAGPRHLPRQAVRPSSRTACRPFRVRCSATCG